MPVGRLFSQLSGRMRLHNPGKYVLERRKAGDKSICDTWPLHGWLDPTSTGIRSLEGAAIPEIPRRTQGVPHCTSRKARFAKPLGRSDEPEDEPTISRVISPSMMRYAGHAITRKRVNMNRSMSDNPLLIQWRFKTGPLFRPDIQNVHRREKLGGHCR